MPSKTLISSPDSPGFPALHIDFDVCPLSTSFADLVRIPWGYLYQEKFWEDPPNVNCHSIHGTGIFTYCYHKNQPNVGKFWFLIMVNIPVNHGSWKTVPPSLLEILKASARRSDRRLSKEKEVWTPWTVHDRWQDGKQQKHWKVEGLKVLNFWNFWWKLRKGIEKRRDIIDGYHSLLENQGLLPH